MSYQFYINFPPPPISAWYVRRRRLDFNILTIILKPLTPMKAIQTGLGILLSVCPFLSSLSAYFRDIQTYQAAKGVLDDFDTLADLLESVEHFLNRLDIYTKITPTVTMTEMIVKILVELLSILALATKQLQQGKLSESVLGDISYHLTMQRRGACQEAASRWEGHRGGTSEVGSAHWG